MGFKSNTELLPAGNILIRLGGERSCERKVCCPRTQWATLKAGMMEQLNGGMTEQW